jgi:hypothetical protein
MEMFNERVRRIANLRAYGMEPADIIKQVDAPVENVYLLVACADLFIQYAPFDLPERTEPAPSVTGEFTAR